MERRGATPSEPQGQRCASRYRCALAAATGDNPERGFPRSRSAASPVIRAIIGHARI